MNVPAIIPRGKDNGAEARVKRETERESRNECFVLCFLFCAFRSRLHPILRWPTLGTVNDPSFYSYFS